MKGTVEVLEILQGGKENLIYKEDNLIVNLAGQTIVDMLTTPSSTLGIAPAVMDTSNWVIQAISFGKDASAYKGNAHAYPSRRNLFRWSTVSSHDPNAGTGNQASVFVGSKTTFTTVSSAPEVSPPPEYSHIPSSVAHVTRLTADKVDKGQSVSQYIKWSDGFDNAWQAGNYELTFSAIDNNWVCGSVYFKLDLDTPFYPSPLQDAGTNTNYFVRTVRFLVDANGEGSYSIAAPPDKTKNARSVIDVAFKTNPNTGLPDQPEASSVTVYHQGDNRSEGFVVSAWQPNIGIIDAGNGWYRAYMSVLAPSATSGVAFSVGPKGPIHMFTGASVPTGSTGASGAVYTYGWQMERGRWPTSLQFNSQFSPDMWEMSGGVLGYVPPGTGISTPSDAGTVRVSGSYYPNGDIVSSYLPTNSLDTLSRKYPDPLDSHLVSTDMKGNYLDTESPFDASSVLSGLGIGQNLNMLPYRNQVGDLSTYGESLWYNAFPANVDEGNPQYDMWKAYTSAYTAWDKTNLPLSAMGNIGPQALTMGCYAEGSSSPAGGTEWAIVSSLDNSGGYGWYGEDAMLSGVYDGGFNEASSMDALGYVGKVYNPMAAQGNSGNVGLSVQGVALSAYGLIVSSPGTAIDTDTFGSWGKVTYECTISSGDCGMANLYGGISNIGLWTLDTKETIKTDSEFITETEPTALTPPFTFNPLFPLKYRLFSSKKFIENLTRVSDDRSGAFPAGAIGHRDLKIRWTIDFRATGNA